MTRFLNEKTKIFEMTIKQARFLIFVSKRVLDFDKQEENKGAKDDPKWLKM